MIGRTTVILDGQAGSCGKGKMVGYYALQYQPDVAINNFMSNAGHTFVMAGDKPLMTQHLPTSMINPHTTLCLGPGSVITPELLIDEVRKYRKLIGKRPVFVHPRAMVIKERHREKEKQIVQSGSTFKGCGTAQADKIMRIPGTELFGDFYNSLPEDVKEVVIVFDTSEIVNDALDSGQHVLVEGSQGSDLDINHGLEYPHVTSRQCNASQLVADCGIAPTEVDEVIMVIRPYPIRINNKTEMGDTRYTGDYADSAEISWEDIKKRCGAPDNAEFGEMTTVTKKPRRVFEMSWKRLKYNVRINRPTAICLNFAQYIDWNVYQASMFMQITSPVQSFMNTIQKQTKVPVLFIGTGPANHHMINLSPC